MKFNDVRPETFVRRLRCDRCGREAGHEESEFHEFTSIDYRTGYGSIFGDGNQVEIDLCQHCLKETLGNSLRVEEPKDWGKLLEERLLEFDPDKHGGEFPTPEKLPVQKRRPI